MTAPGWCETISLNDVETAIVAVRQGAPVELRFPDFERSEPCWLPGRECRRVVSALRESAALGVRPELRVLFGEGGIASVVIALERVEPLIALLRRALAFSEGA